MCFPSAMIQVYGWSTFWSYITRFSMAGTGDTSLRESIDLFLISLGPRQRLWAEWKLSNEHLWQGFAFGNATPSGHSAVCLHCEVQNTTRANKSHQLHWFHQIKEMLMHHGPKPLPEDQMEGDRYSPICLKGWSGRHRIWPCKCCIKLIRRFMAIHRKARLCGAFLRQTDGSHNNYP